MGKKWRKQEDDRNKEKMYTKSLSESEQLKQLHAVTDLDPNFSRETFPSMRVEEKSLETAESVQKAKLKNLKPGQKSGGRKHQES